MQYQVTTCSPEMQKLIVEGAELPEHFGKYPFNLLEIGQSFTVPLEEANESSLRSRAAQESKRQGKVFKVIKHRNHKLIEVGRIL